MAQGELLTPRIPPGDVVGGTLDDGGLDDGGLNRAASAASELSDDFSGWVRR